MTEQEDTQSRASFTRCCCHPFLPAARITTTTLLPLQERYLVSFVQGLSVGNNHMRGIRATVRSSRWERDAPNCSEISTTVSYLDLASLLLLLLFFFSSPCSSLAFSSPSFLFRRVFLNTSEENTEKKEQNQWWDNCTLPGTESKELLLLSNILLNPWTLCLIAAAPWLMCYIFIIVLVQIRLQKSSKDSYNFNTVSSHNCHRETEIHGSVNTEMPNANQHIPYY